MILTEIGEARIRGYLFVLERSLKTFLPRDVVADAVREIESHLRERVESTPTPPDEREALEKILAELGPPLRVAQAYSAERTIDEAVMTGRFFSILRAVWHLAATTVIGFFAALGLFVGYVVSFAFLAIAALKPIFPDNVGVWVQDDGGPGMGFGVQFPPLPPHQHVEGGYWVILIGLVVGLGLLVLMQRGARAFLKRWREKRVS